MISASRGAFQGANTRARYAQAWSMFHFLIEGSGGARRLQSYLDLIETGMGMGSRTNDFLRVYGTDLEALEAAWVRHIDGLVSR